MKKNLLIYTCILFFVSSCSSPEPTTVTDQDLLGNWIITDIESTGKTAEENQAYVMNHDSIRALKGLKLVSIKKDAIFQQGDSLNVFPGSWLFNSIKQQLYINNGGLGFSNFIGDVKMDKDVLLITEKMNLESLPVSVTWHLKKISADSPASFLFIPSNNSWRNKPKQSEDEVTMRKRLSVMFHYYGIYFALISREADYFSPKRVLLPVRYYRHGVGMRDLDAAENFRSICFDDSDFKKAYGMISDAIKSESHYPKGQDFTEEYSRYFLQLEHAIAPK